jgi:hypothetical protein
MEPIRYEVYQQGPVIDWQGITPVKTEPVVFRAIQELISSQLFTQQLVTQQLGALAAGGKSFIRSGQRAEEGGAFDDSAQQIQMLTQRVQELEKKLESATAKTAGR